MRNMKKYNKNLDSMERCLKFLQEVEMEEEVILDKWIKEYRQNFNYIVDDLMKNITFTSNEYEKLLRLKYEYKYFKGIDTEFLIELKHGNYTLNLDKREDRLEFLKKNKDLFPYVFTQLKEDLSKYEHE